MTILAGVDIGNATTEIVIAKQSGSGLTVVHAQRFPTRGRKGSSRSLHGAATALAHLQRRDSFTLDHVVIAPTVPVDSRTHVYDSTATSTGRIRITAIASPTTFGDGAAVGTPVAVHDLGQHSVPGPVLAVVPSGVDYRDAAALINAAGANGVPVIGCIASADEAVLIGHRLDTPMPIVDGIDIAPILAASRVALEVRPPGRGLTKLTDPLWLTSQLNLDQCELDDARHAAARLADNNSAAVHLGDFAAPSPDTVQPPPDGLVVNLADIADAANMRQGSIARHALISAHIDTTAACPAARDTLQQLLGIPVVMAESETAAARAGALTTPGATPDGVVIDIGGGTVDVIDAQTRTALPGAGNMLTIAAAAALGTTRSVAEYVKRSEALLPVAPQLVEDERGHRSFLTRPVVGQALHQLCTRTPAGLQPFSSTLSLSEWRAWRRTAKRHIIGTNIDTGTHRLGRSPRTAILVGGGAGDDELVSIANDLLGDTCIVGRGQVAGSLGHRFGVAHGLVLLATLGKVARADELHAHHISS